MSSVHPLQQQSELIEPIPIQPVFCDGLALVDVRGDQMHFSLYVEQHSIDDPLHGFERAVNLRVIIPIAGVAAALPKVIGAMPMAVANILPIAARRIMGGDHS